MSKPAINLDSFEACGDRIRWMLALLAWVENARQVLDSLDIHAQIRPRLREQLQASNTRYVLGWQEDQSAGLQELQTVIARMTAEMAQAGDALARQRCAA